MCMRVLTRALSRIYSTFRSSKRRLLPPEVWLAVLESGVLDSNDISNVRLTCRLFTALGKIQAFSSFKVSPFVLVGNPTNYRWSFRKDLAAQCRKRLEFWASDDIAPLVRHCEINPRYYTKDLASSVDSREDANYLIDVVFQTLPRFFNLNCLDCSHCPFSDRALSLLRQLPKLRTLKVTDCTVTASAAPQPKLEIPDVHFSSKCSTYDSVEERGNVGWLDVLHPDTIRCIWISLSEPKVIHLRGIATTRSLCDLSAPESDNVSRHIISILSHPSALEELRIFPYLSKSCDGNLEPPRDYALGALSLPSLRDYSGPHQFLSWVSTGPRLCSAKLIALNQSRYVSWSALLTTITRETISHSIQNLTIRVDDIPEALLMAISARFTRIQALKMYAKRTDEDKLMAAALANFPPGIETVDLDLWNLDPNMNRIKWIKRAFKLKSGLFDNYPALRRATCTVAGRYMGFDWRRSDKIIKSRIVRGVKTAAYVSGILSEEDT